MFDAHVIAVDTLAVILAIIGFHMAFRQRLVQRLVRRWTGRPLDTKPRPADDESPARYALIIFGVMIMAFGVILFMFTTLFALFSA